MDEDIKVRHSLAYRNADAPSPWTEVLDGRVWASRDLNSRELNFEMPLY